MGNDKGKIFCYATRGSTTDKPRQTAEKPDNTDFLRCLRSRLEQEY